MSAPVVNTQYGPVRGWTEDGVSRFFGIPYAVAPVGAQRFRAPAPHPGWDQVRDATQLGPNAPHAIKAFPGLDVEPIIGSFLPAGSRSTMRAVDAGFSRSSVRTLVSSDAARAPAAPRVSSMKTSTACSGRGDLTV